MTRRALLALALFAVVGCAQQPLYHGPSFLNSRDSRADRRRYERFDPLPSEDIAPETFARPRDYDDQRPLSRRAFEGRRLLGAPATAPNPFTPSARNDYPGVVN